MFRAVITFLCALLCSSSILAQVASELRGQVRDASGASVVGAQLRLTQQATHAAFTTTTDASGFFAFAELVPGRYDLETRAAGFRTETDRGIVISIGGTVNRARDACGWGSE